MTCPKLIEVALPIREISAESVRDKSLRHGHISTLHLWWARRPLAASRAVVFASLVPDPDHPECPAEFREAVERLLKRDVPLVLKGYGEGRKRRQDPDPYRPYDFVEDTPRNRLLAFIAKWSPEWLAFERGDNGKQPKPEEMLDARSLVKWETSNPDNQQGQIVLSIARELVCTANGGVAPTIVDPMAGGGALPLEAMRVGCQVIANDYNPVAYLILRATCEYPQRYGKPIEIAGTPKTQPALIDIRCSVPLTIENRLAHDVEYWAKWILERARKRIGHLYKSDKDGRPIVGYLWARTAPCSNPACRAEIPLLRTLLVCNKTDKQVALEMRVKGRKVSFGIVEGVHITRTEGTMIEKGRGSARCAICGQTTPVDDLRRAGIEGKLGERMVAVIVRHQVKQARRIKGKFVTMTKTEKTYRSVAETDLEIFEEAKRLAEKVERPSEPIRPEVTLSKENISTRGDITVVLYGLKTWGSLFNPRQLLTMQTFVEHLRKAVNELEKHESDQDYRKAITVYLGLWLTRVSQRSSNVGIWHTSRETLEHPFGRQAIPLSWDYPESNPFSEATGSAIGQLDWILRVIRHESSRTARPTRVLFGDAAHLDIENGIVEMAVTDPPYFDAIAYADLSDFFYVWLKRALAESIPELFATPLTPKADEATALRHRYSGDGYRAKEHFSSKLAECFAEAKRVCKSDGTIAVMFAHQSTEAWTALVNALFKAGLNITATYPIDTELTTALKSWKSALESSITVVCRPRAVGVAATFKEVRREIVQVVADSVRRFWQYGFRGADLIVACYGPAVGVFGRYERVERADGTPVTVTELLETARQAALKAIAGEFQGDDLSRLYFVWVNQYGMTEQSFDDLVKVALMSIEDEDAMEIAHRRGLFVVDGGKCRLALLRDRVERRHLGEDTSAPLIDQLHHAMLLWKEGRRSHLVDYLRKHDLLDQAGFWKLGQALFEVLPHNEEDWKLVTALLGERETLRKESLRVAAPVEARLF
jgi:adenine-specific DNA methylase